MHLPDQTESEEDWEKEEVKELAQFLDFLWEDIINNPDKLVPYTEEMYKRDKEDWEMEP